MSWLSKEIIDPILNAAVPHAVAEALPADPVITINAAHVQAAVNDAVAAEGALGASYLEGATNLIGGAVVAWFNTKYPSGVSVTLPLREELAKTALGSALGMNTLTPAEAAAPLG